MRRRSKILLLVLGIVFLAAAGWFGYGMLESNRFDERLAALYADGSLKTFAQLQGEPIPERENGWALLEEADEQARAIEREIFNELLEEGTTDLKYAPADRKVWTPDQVAHEKRVLGAYALVFAKLDAALERPRCVRLGTPPLDSTVLGPVLSACQRWMRRMRMEPTRYPEDVDRMLRLFDRWEVRDGGDASMRPVFWRSLVLTALREGLEGGHIDEAQRSAWGDVLQREEQRLRAGATLQEGWRRAALVWLIQGWRRGEDPMAPLRARFSFPGLPDMAITRPFRDAGRPPWYVAWYGRPWMQRRANVELDALRAVRPTAAHYARQRLHTLATLRLARVAHAVRGAIAKGDTGPPFDLRLGVAARLGGQHLQDPLSAKLFVLDAREKHVVIHVRPSDALDALDAEYAQLEGAAREKRLHDDLLLWRIPVP